MLKILFIISDHKVQGRIIESYEKYFARSNFETMSLDFTIFLDAAKIEDRRESERVYGEIFERIRGFAPDFAFAYNIQGMMANGSGFLFQQLRIPLINLCLDNPFLVMSKEKREEIKSHPSFYVNLIWDKIYLDHFRRYVTDVNTFHILNSADDELFRPSEGERSVDLLFVGDIQKPDAINALYKNLGDEAFVRIVREIEKRKFRDFSFVPALFLESLASRGVIHENLLVDHTFNKNFVDYVNAQLSYRFRHFLVTSIRDVDVDVYSLYDPHAAGNIRYRGVCDYLTEYPAILASTKIQLDIPRLQLQTSLNTRPFESFLAGALCLSEYKDDLNLITDDPAEISFRTLDELREKIDLYLNNEHRRKEVTTKIRSRIESSHTYRSRVFEIADHLNSSQLC